MDVNRRTLIVGGTSALVGAGAAGFLTADRTGPTLWQRGDRSGAPQVGGLHLQYGADAASEVVVSWHTAAAVNNPRVMVGTPDDGVGRTAAAETVTYRDAASRTEIRVHHGRLANLAPDTDYVYAAVHDGASPEVGRVRTAPRGRAPVRFTSFGDQSTPTLDALVASAFGSDNRGSPSAGDITTAVEHAAPLFNLVNGDLYYANLPRDRVRTWSDWFENNSRSARYRQWMPAAGNHENELGNGPIGYGAYQAYFALPDSGSDPELRGLWYAFTAGSVRVISLANDDVCYQDGGNSYVRGYSGDAQKRWLEQELERTRSDSRPTRLRRTRSTPNRITSTPPRARFIWSSAAEARRSRPTRCSFPNRDARSSWQQGMSTPTPVTRHRGTSRKPHRGRCFGIATSPAASSHSTSTQGSLAGTRRWPPRTTRSTGRSEN